MDNWNPKVATRLMACVISNTKLEQPGWAVGGRWKEEGILAACYGILLGGPWAFRRAKGNLTPGRHMGNTSFPGISGGCGEKAHLEGLAIL